MAANNNAQRISQLQSSITSLTTKKGTYEAMNIKITNAINQLTFGKTKATEFRNKLQNNYKSDVVNRKIREIDTEIQNITNFITQLNSALTSSNSTITSINNDISTKNAQLTALST